MEINGNLAKKPNFGRTNHTPYVTTQSNQHSTHILVLRWRVRSLTRKIIHCSGYQGRSKHILGGPASGCNPRAWLVNRCGLGVSTVQTASLDLATEGDACRTA